MRPRWTAERRAQQAAAIQRWKPWEKSTGPRTAEGKAIVSRNAFKGAKRIALRRQMREVRQFIREAGVLLKEAMTANSRSSVRGHFANGRHLGAARAFAGLTQFELAQLAGVHVNGIKIAG
jgi:hypothetical protein